MLNQIELKNDCWCIELIVYALTHEKINPIKNTL
jgi:hypothetical protein